MKRLVSILSFLVLLTCLSATSSSCSRKSGCPAYESTQVQTDRKGRLSTKGGSSRLFDPKRVKSSRKRGR